MSVYSSFEIFYDDYRKEIAPLFPNLNLEFDIKEANKLKRLIQNYKIIRKTDCQIEQSILDCFDYYHALRNYVVHMRRVESNKVQNKYNKLDSENIKTIFNHLPNPPGNQEFSDYLVFSKATKKICAELCSNFEVEEKDVIRLLPGKLLQNKNDKKKDRAFTEYFRREYGFTEQDIKMLKGEYMTR